MPMRVHKTQTRWVRRREPGAGTRVLQVWLLQHLQALVFSLGQLARNPLGSLMTAAVIGISLALPAGFYLILDNARQVATGWDGSVQITLFLRLDVPDEQAQALAARLKANQEIASVKFISRAEALAEYRRLSGFAEALDALEDNPLPAVLLIKPTASAQELRDYETLLESLKRLPEVEAAQFDRQWVRRLHAILIIVQRSVLILASLLALAVLLIVGNTIRLGIYNCRSEIEITKLFGATDAFIQRPFLYTGMWYGLFGSLLAWLLIAIAFLLLQKPGSDLARLYGSDFQLGGLGPPQLAMLVGSGLLLGLVGSWLAVKRHLRAIEPS
jgi:cell division transport system permease protein